MVVPPLPPAARHCPPPGSRHTRDARDGVWGCGHAHPPSSCGPSAAARASLPSALLWQRCESADRRGPSLGTSLLGGFPVGLYVPGVCLWVCVSHFSRFVPYLLTHFMNRASEFECIGIYQSLCV